MSPWNVNLRQSTLPFFFRSFPGHFSGNFCSTFPEKLLIRSQWNFTCVRSLIFTRQHGSWPLKKSKRVFPYLFHYTICIGSWHDQGKLCHFRIKNTCLKLVLIVLLATNMSRPNTIPFAEITLPVIMTRAIAGSQVSLWRVGPTVIIVWVFLVVFFL